MKIVIVVKIQMKDCWRLIGRNSYRELRKALYESSCYFHSTENKQKYHKSQNLTAQKRNTKEDSIRQSRRGYQQMR